MTRPHEFNFSGVPGRPHKVTIDLDKVGFYNECANEDGFYYARTNIYMPGESDPRIILDINYKEFKQIMNTK